MEKEEREKERRRKRGEEELVGMVVDRGKIIRKIKEEKREKEQRGENEKNKERIYRRGGRALTTSSSKNSNEAFFDIFGRGTSYSLRDANGYEGCTSMEFHACV